MEETRGDIDQITQFNQNQGGEMSITKVTSHTPSQLLISGYPPTFPFSSRVLHLNNNNSTCAGDGCIVTSEYCLDCRIHSGLKNGITKPELEKNSPDHYYGMFPISQTKRIIEKGNHGSYFLASENCRGEVHLSTLVIKANGKKFYFDPLGDCPRDLQSVANLGVSVTKWQGEEKRTCGFHCHFFRDFSPKISSVMEIDQWYCVSENGDPDVFVVKEFEKKRRKEMAEGKSVEFQYKCFSDIQGTEITPYRKTGEVDPYLDISLRNPILLSGLTQLQPSE